MNKLEKQQRYAVLKQAHQTRANMNYLLEVFGCELAERRGWTFLDGFEALRFHLMQKHNWTPAQVNAMSHEDLHFALSEELTGWVAPDEAR